MKRLMDSLVGSCQASQDAMSDHLDGGLGTAQALRLRLHLLGCNACRHVLASLRTTIDRLRQLDRDRPAGQSIAPTVLDRIGRGG